MYDFISWIQSSNSLIPSPVPEWECTIKILKKSNNNKRMISTQKKKIQQSPSILFSGKNIPVRFKVGLGSPNLNIREKRKKNFPISLIKLPSRSMSHGECVVQIYNVLVVSRDEEEKRRKKVDSRQEQEWHLVHFGRERKLTFFFRELIMMKNWGFFRARFSLSIIT